MIKGRGVSKGIGFGKALFLESRKLKIPQNKIEDVNFEIQKLEETVSNIIDETKKLINKSEGSQKEILEAHLLILEDETLVAGAKELIKNKKENAVKAIDESIGEIIENFKNIDDDYLSQRSEDIEEIKYRIIEKLLGVNNVNLGNIEEKIIIVAKEITISDISKIDLKNVEGMISEIGGPNSHLSIIAKTRKIPFIIGIENITNTLKDEISNKFLAIDGEKGEIYVNPSKEEIKKLKEKMNLELQKFEKLKAYKNIKTATKDGIRKEVLANIATEDDIDLAIENGAEGIGLFRSEFLYMNENNFPSEEKQFKCYKKVVEKMGDKPTIIRTLDAGGDKNIKYLNLEREDNPFLGYRAIRICLDNPEMFKVQLRALLRASAFGNLQIMLPMISNIEELIRSKELIDEVKKELKEKNIRFNENVKVGIMIEIPSAAILAEEFAQYCDFFSIGTNDLIQYTVAAERGNKNIAKLYTKNNPAVIKLIKITIDAAHKRGIPCGMCGEAASDEKFINVLIGLGLDEFSMTPNKILKVKEIITKLDVNECKSIVKSIFSFNSSSKIENFLTNAQLKHF